jgi:hypothetical protein
MTLSVRTSANNREYLSGWLGKAKLVGFKAKESDRFGNPQWQIYASEPAERQEQPHAPASEKVEAA